MIAFDPGCLETVAAAAKRAYPEECCGLLIGRRTNAGALRVTTVAESVNVASGDRARRFEIDPALRLSLMRRLRGSADSIIGHYHSHPDGGAVPSEYDASMVFEPELIWLIAGLAAGSLTEMACWRWDPVAARFVAVAQVGNPGPS